MSTAIAPKPNVSGKVMIQFPQSMNFIEDIEAMNREIARRAFSLFQQRGGMHGFDLADWLRAESEIIKPIPIDLTESSNGYTIRAEVPGFEAKDLNIQAETNSVYLRGKRESKNEEKKGGGLRYCEVSATEVCRRVALPTAIDPDKAGARLANGILEVTLPKASPPRRVDVKSA